MLREQKWMKTVPYSSDTFFFLFTQVRDIKKCEKKQKQKMKLLKLSNFVFIEIIKEKQHKINSGNSLDMYIHIKRLKLKEK